MLYFSSNFSDQSILGIILWFFCLVLVWDLKGPACGTQNSLLARLLTEFLPLRLVGLLASAAGGSRPPSPLPPAEVAEQPHFALKMKKHPIGCFFILVAGVGFEPHGLRVMSPTSYQAALPRDILVPETGIEPVRDVSLTGF